MAGKHRKRQRLHKDAKIAIVGGGLGGMSAALSLRQEGFENVTVYERDGSLDEAKEGFGLTLTYNPKGPLAKMGILEKVAQQDCPSRSHYVFSTDGTVVGYYGNAFYSHRGAGQRGNMRVPRRVLRRILFEQSTCEVKWGKQLESFDFNTDGKLELFFQDGAAVSDIDVLVGADGVRSRVVKNLWTNKQDKKFGLQYMGVMIILGIADFCHPLLDERGFYTLDGTHRLFTMPYSGCKMEDQVASQDDLSNKVGSKRRIMWQLSYQLGDEVEAKRLREAGPQALLDEVLRRCQTWHEPVLSMFKATSLDTVWGTGLVDRKPEELLLNLDTRFGSRVVVLGDAAHSMSPFKGQGANQSLLDGPLLASWLGRASLESAIGSFMKEMAIRSGPKVKASREAAKFFHSPQILKEKQHFAGVRPDSIPLLIETLRCRSIAALKEGMLDESIRQVIEELNAGEDTSSQSVLSKQSVNIRLQLLALALSSKGDTAGLRNLGFRHVHAIQSARDAHGRTCLDLAAQGGHYNCCRWLLSEALGSHQDLNVQKNRAREAAVLNGDKNLATLLISTSSETILDCREQELH